MESLISSYNNWFHNPQLLILAAECPSYSSLTSGDRKTTYRTTSASCDENLKGWYRFQGAAGTRMPTTCPPKYRCNTYVTGWLNGGHPTVADGKVSREVCFHWHSICCYWSTNIEVRNCGSYYVYRPLSRNAQTKDFARPTSHPVRGWTGKNKAFCSPGTQNGRRVIKVYYFNGIPCCSCRYCGTD